MKTLTVTPAVTQGRWPLAAGRWPLAAGRWPLAAWAVDCVGAREQQIFK